MNTKISKNKVKNLIKKVAVVRYGAFCDEERCIEIDYEPVSRIVISWANDNFYIKAYSKYQHNKPVDIQYANTQHETLKWVGVMIPNFLKLNNNF